ncbi:MAG: tetratricopeptide repeat protein [Pseudomonadota bacterium]
MAFPPDALVDHLITPELIENRGTRWRYIIVCREFPQSANARDSLGEAYRAAGRREDAIASYKRALQINRQMPSAVTALKEMRFDGGVSN